MDNNDINVTHRGTGEKETSFSLLMSVYRGETAEYFSEALASVFASSLLPSEIVLVCDGPLTEPLEAVIQHFTERYPALFLLVRLPENGGLGKALNAGLAACKNDLVARMDTDDISYPERFERQVAFMRSHPEVGVLSAAIDEFADEKHHIVAKRILPEDHDTIKRFAKKRCPVNHPVVMFRKSEVLRAGGYRHCPSFEDYYLWARMLLSGTKFHNMSEPLLAFRMDDDTLKRRRGLRYAQREHALLKKLRREGFLNFYEYLRNAAMRLPLRLAPPSVLKYVYRRTLRTG